MAIKRRLRGYSSIRLDLSHLRLFEAAVTGDFDDVLKGFVTGLDRPYLVRGFDVVGNSADYQSDARALRLKVADSVLLHSSATEAGTILRIPSNEADITINGSNPRVIGDWVQNAINYVSIDYRRTTDPNTVDATAAFSPTEKIEIQKSVPIGMILDYRIIISTTGFGNFMPLYRVQLFGGSSFQIQEISNSRPHFFRLGTGGAVPNPNHNFPWVTGGTPQTRVEGSPTIGSSELLSITKPWDRGDYAIKNLKDVFDAIFTRFKEITGSSFWYTGSTLSTGEASLNKLYFDSIGSKIVSSGKFALELKADIAVNNITTQNDAATLTENLDSTNPTFDIWVSSSRANPVYSVTNRESVGSIRTLTVSSTHNIEVGDTIVISGINSNYDGSHVAQAGTTGTTIVYNSLSFNESSTASGGTAELIDVGFLVTDRESVGFTRTLTTFSPHSYSADDIIIVDGVDPLYNGSFRLTAVSANTLSYSTSTFLSESFTSSGGTIRQQDGQGRAKKLIGNSILRLSQTSGAFSPGDSLSFRLSQTAPTINRSNDVAVISVPHAEVYRHTTPAITNLTVTNRETTATERVLTVGAHTVQIDDIVRVSGINIDYDGDFVVTDTTGTTISYDRFAAPLESSTASSGSVAQGSKFVATISGAIENNFNKNEAYMFILDDTPGLGQVGYAVQAVGSLSEAGSFLFDGLLASATILSIPNSVSAGPLSWDQDIYVKSIIGTRQYLIPHDATAAPPYDTYGPGTVDIPSSGYVAYIRLHRDLPLGSGIYNITNGVVVPNPVGQVYVGSDGSIQTLMAGDYVKVATDSDSKWFKINAAGQLLQQNEQTLVHLAPINYPNHVGVSLSVSKYRYDEIEVAQRQLMPDSSDVFWIAIREDRNSVPVVYLRDLELEAGEERDISDNTANNLLMYTGAMTESAVNPNYSKSIGDAAYAYEEYLNVEAIEPFQNIVYLQNGPGFGIQIGDILVSGVNTYTVAYPLDNKTFVAKESVSSLSTGAARYRRPSRAMDDTDNLTRGARKIDRTLARILTILDRPVYDESVFVQSIGMTSGADTAARAIRSGYWLESSSGGLAWVLAASNDGSAQFPLEVKDPLTGSDDTNRLLIHVISGTFNNGDTLTQAVPNATAASRVQNSDVEDVMLWGDDVTGQNIKLPPNTRTGISNNGSASPTLGQVQPYASYNAAANKGGGELLLIANDTPRECGIDFLEDSNSPGPARFINSTIENAATIKLVRPMPLFTRLRFRNLSTFGLPPIVAPSSVTLQSAYNGPQPSPSGSTITTVSGVPVTIQNPSLSEEVLRINGRLVLDQGAGTAILPSGDLGSSVGTGTNRFGQSHIGVLNVRSTPTGQFPGSDWKFRTAGVVTNSASFSNIYSETLPVNTSVKIRAEVMGRRTDVVGGYASFVVEALLAREGGSAAVIAAPVTTIVSMSPVAYAYSATIVASGSNFSVVVAGDTGHTVTWVSSISYQVVGTSS